MVNIKVFVILLLVCFAFASCIPEETSPNNLHLTNSDSDDIPELESEQPDATEKPMETSEAQNSRLLTESDETLKQARADIFRQLEEESVIIGRLVENVQAYADQEREFFAEIVTAKNQLSDAETLADAEIVYQQLWVLTEELSILVANYPEIRSSQTFITLREELQDARDRLAILVTRYNERAAIHNDLITKMGSDRDHAQSISFRQLEPVGELAQPTATRLPLESAYENQSAELYNWYSETGEIRGRTLDEVPRTFVVVPHFGFSHDDPQTVPELIRHHVQIREVIRMYFLAHTVRELEGLENRKRVGQDIQLLLEREFGVLVEAVDFTRYEFIEF